MSIGRKRIAILGATSGIAEGCARLWAEEGGRDFVLLGREAKALEAIAADLRVRDPKADVTTLTSELADVKSVDAGLAQLHAGGAFEVVLIAFGVLPDQEHLQGDTEALAESMKINALAPVLWAEGFARMAGIHPTHIAVIGSVAGDRGRKSNYAYGAAKGMIDRYIEGMQHRFAALPSGPVAILIKPGPTQTAMTKHMDQAKMAPVAQVAREIVAGIKKGAPVIYTPRKWAVIMAVIRNLPRVVFNRMDI